MSHFNYDIQVICIKVFINCEQIINENDYN